MACFLLVFGIYLCVAAVIGAGLGPCGQTTYRGLGRSHTVWLRALFPDFILRRTLRRRFGVKVAHRHRSIRRGERAAELQHVSSATEPGGLVGGSWARRGRHHRGG